MRCLLPTAILAVSLTGCAGDAQKVVGNWVSSGKLTGVVQQLALSPDGQYRHVMQRKVAVSGKLNVDDSYGTYTVSAGILTLTSSTPGAGVVKFKIASVTDSTLVLETTSGPIEVTSYTRVVPGPAPAPAPPR